MADPAHAALDALVKLARAHRSVMRLVHEHLAEDGLTVAQFGVLETLLHVGPQRQAEIADRLLCSAGNITQLLQRMESDGMVRRVTDPGDARGRLVQLTAKGRRCIERVFARHVAVVGETFGVLTGAELRQLSSLLRTLGRDAAGLDGE